MATNEERFQANKTIEEKFQAAVNVIKGLPKNGPYQPSTAMMLRFYGFYKQATEGKCNQKKPPFWDIVGKAKWDAWNENRHLTKHQAMMKYVENLREIIETMSFTENVQHFVGSLNELEINLNDLEAVAPGMREIAENHPDSPFKSRSASPQQEDSSNESIDVIETTSNHMPNGRDGRNSPNMANNIVIQNGHEKTKNEQIKTTQEQFISTRDNTSLLVEQSDDEYGDPYDLQQDFQETMTQQTQTLQQVKATVLLLNADLVALNRRTVEIEQILRELRLQMQLLTKFNNSKMTKAKTSSWWPFNDISPAWFALLILWPFTIKYVKRLLLPHSRHTKH